MGCLTHRKPAWRRLSSPDLQHCHYEEFYRAFMTGQWEPGSRVATMERAVARTLGVDAKQVLATASATAALDAATRAFFDVDEWAICPMTYAATWVAVLNQGGRVRWVDCDDAGWPIKPVHIGVELWGRRWPQQDRPVILDCAHRAMTKDQVEHFQHGTRALVYSFNVQKEISCLHGGALVLSPADVELAPAIRQYLRCGTKDRKGQPGALGTKGYLQDPLAGLITSKIRRLGRYREKRQQILGWYQQYLGRALMTLPDASGSLAVLRYKTQHERDLVRQHLRKNLVETSIHYDVSEEFQCPQAAALSKRILTVPCHVDLQEVDVKRLCRLIASA